MASVVKRKNHFQIVASLGYDSSGKQIRKTTTFIPPEGTTPKKAEKLAKEFAIKFQNKCKGHAELDENMTFSELVELYNKLYVPDKLKPVTAYTYAGQIKNHLMPVFSNVKLKDFSPLRITSFFKGVELSNASCKKLLVILESIFTFAVKQGIITDTPCKNIILPRQRTNEDDKKQLSEAQIHKLMEMLNRNDVVDSQFSVIIQTLMYTGMRSGECLGLQWNDIDFEKNRIYIRHTLVYDGEKRWLDTPKTQKSKRTIAISAELKSVLLNHKQRQQIITNKVGYSFNPLGMVFTSKTGNFKDRSILLKEFKTFIKDTDFSYISLHTLRHANATLLLANGIDIKLVSAHLGHSTIKTTADIYADVLESTKDNMASLISLKLT